MKRAWIEERARATAAKQPTATTASTSAVSTKLWPECLRGLDGFAMGDSSLPSGHKAVPASRGYATSLSRYDRLAHGPRVLFRPVNPGRDGGTRRTDDPHWPRQYLRTRHEKRGPS